MSVMKAYFLGTFKLEYKGKTLTFNDYHSLQITKFIAYLIKNRKKKIFNSEIADVLYKDKTTSDPINALKALVYRTRTVLKQGLGDDDFIISSKGIYHWNPEIEVILDLEELENYKNMAVESDNKIEYYEKCLSLYGGHVLPMISGESWVDMDDSYVESTILSTMIILLDYYFENNLSSKFRELSKKVLEIDPYNEGVHYHVMSDYLRDGKEELAKKYYEQVAAMFNKNLGIAPSSKLQQLIEGQTKMDFDELKSYVHNNNEVSLAFEASPDVFKDLCLIESKRIRRSKKDAFIVNLTIKIKNKDVHNKDFINAILESTASLLKNAIMTKLRSGDCFTQVGKDRFLVLIYCDPVYIDGVIKRIVDTFYILDKYRRVDVEYTAQDIRDLITED
ncbi:bacterial transcriptional activator domain-containing protein [Kandleria vitulina]|nr:BTAD domain-containing putative transcriptional regulator [Kandleria vitulina]